MHIIGHLTVGIVGSLITGNYLFLIGSLAPDLALIPNELKKKTFNKWNVKWKFLYNITHSLFLPLGLWFVNPFLSLGWLIHIILDIPFHTSSFRWRPFLLNRYKPKKKALLLSGGMDSVACALIEKDFDCIYFNYGQVYHDKEYPFAKETAEKLGKELIVINKPWKTDIPNRNFMMVVELKSLGYGEVIVGSRNILPLFDKYGDSNWFNMKLLQHLCKVYINMPLTGMFKFQIKKKVKDYGYYSTENYFKLNK